MRGPTDGESQAVDPGARKERVLHTRVPESLDRHIKRRARSLGLTVSTIVRHVLLNTFGLVEDIVADSANAALAITGQPAVSPPDDDGVLGWQEIVLNLNAVCVRCNAVLRKGVRAAAGVRERPGARAVICRRCLGRLEHKR